MFTQLRSKLTYSNAISSLALFVALSGVAVAAGLPKNSVGTKQLKKNAVTAAKLKKSAVIAGKLSANAVGTGNLGNGVVTSAKLGANSVIASTIKNGVVTTNKLDNEAVTTAKLGKGSVTAAKLSDELGPLVGTLKSGQTIRGVFNLGGSVKSAEPISFRDAIGFQFPLLNTPNPNILQPATTSPSCTGLGGGATPQAAAGQLCIYITGATPETELGIDTGSNNRLGFGLLAKFKKAEDDNFIRGQWAVTAP